ncbi:metallophosphoesterase family protein [bacterium]|nr:metallophosphoesterase family protein [bacterium]
MIIAVISDIHGNMQALEAVLKDIKLANVDKILCLGDLVMAGPEPKKTLDFIMQMKDWEIIQGNTDEMVAYSDIAIPNVKEVFPIMGNALENDAKQLNEEEIEFLKNLPKQKELEIEGVKILMVHGSPRKNNENIFPNMKIEEIEEMVNGVDADVILCGHTHMPCGYQTNTKKTVVNVGSVGRPFTDNPQCCYLLANVQNGQIEFIHRLIPYDKETAADILSKRNFEGAEKLSQILIDPKERHM